MTSAQLSKATSKYTQTEKEFSSVDNRHTGSRTVGCNEQVMTGPMNIEFEKGKMEGTKLV